MSDGLIFYWFAWIGCIIVIFFMPDGKLRTFLMTCALLLIFLSYFQLTIAAFTFSLSYAVLLAVTFCLSARLPRTVFHFTVSFIVMIGYAGVLIWYVSTPLELFVPRLAMQPLVPFLLAILLTKGFRNRLISCLSGMAGGEWLYSIILSSYSLPDVIGDMRFFDTAIILVAALVFQHVLAAGKRKLKDTLKSTVLKPAPFVKKKAQ
ncbi:hypothetical protein EU245_05840 [Lentibacillus lipolyticus]|nr:hypothetical protein EU245_05840 [Lentibacillus lipolyticus]